MMKKFILAALITTSFSCAFADDLGCWSFPDIDETGRLFVPSLSGHGEIPVVPGAVDKFELIKAVYESRKAFADGGSKDICFTGKISRKLDAFIVDTVSVK